MSCRNETWLALPEFKRLINAAFARRNLFDAKLPLLVRSTTQIELQRWKLPFCSGPRICEAHHIDPFSRGGLSIDEKHAFDSCVGLQHEPVSLSKFGHGYLQIALLMNHNDGAGANTRLETKSSV